MQASHSLSADLSNPNASFKIRGFLDVGDPREGLTGWAVDISDPKRSLSIELCADSLVIATTKADRQRQDIRIPGSNWSQVGFHFAPYDIRALIIGRDLPPDARLWVRVAGTDFPLKSNKPISSPVEFLAAASKRIDDNQGSAPGPLKFQMQSLPQRTGLDLSASAAARDLPSALQALAARAAAMLRLPLTPSSEKMAGHIECLSWDQDGLVWVFGWMKRRLPLHAPLVIADGAKYPSSFLVATHERDDLPKDAIGIVGLLRTDWRPSYRGSDPLLFVGSDAEACLTLLEKPTLFTTKECADRIEALKPGLSGPFAKPLLQMFGSDTNWAPDSARITDAGIQAAADKVLILPGFGCLVEGWALSPLHAIERFMLKIGKSVLMSERSSVSHKPRPDLSSCASNVHGMVEAAGFTAAFPGQVDEHNTGDVMLKVVCEGGLSTNHAVSVDAIRVLGGSAPFEEVLQYFPSVRAELFFPELARCMSEGMRRRMSQPVGFDVRTAESVLVVAVPDDGSDMALLFSELSLIALRRGRFPPVAVLARAGRHRSAVLSLFSDLRRTVSAASSLFFVHDPAYAVYAVDEVLQTIGADRFAFLGPSIFPTDAGWDALLDRLERGGDDVVFLATEGLADGSVPVASAARAECFVWRRRALAEWMAQTPVFLSGSAGRTLTLPVGSVPALPGVSAKRGRRPTPSIMATWVNEVLLDHPTEAAHA